MRHFKRSDKKSFRQFIYDNAEILMLGGITVISMIIGTFFPSDVKDIFCLNNVVTPKASTLFLNAFIDISFYLFLIFFCGTSAVGFISPVILVCRGYFIGCVIKTVDFNLDLPLYLIAIMPYIVLSFALLILIIRHSVSLSLRVFRTCRGISVFDLATSFRRFILMCGIGLILSAAFSFIYALIYSFLIL